MMPGLRQLINYRREDLSGDLSAGVIVAVMLIPQGMAYAMLAGVEPVIGLYAVTVPLIVYALFASSRQLAVGPVAMVALLVFTGVSTLAEPGTPEYMSYVLILAAMVGLFQLGMGLARLGFLVNFLSHSVINGFTSAAAIVIGLSQLRHLLGIPLATHPYTHQLLFEVLSRIGEIHLYTFALGMSGIALMVILKRLSPRFPTPLLIVGLSIIVVKYFDLHEHGVQIVGHVPQGFPGFSIPVINLEAVSLLLPTALTITFVGFMESIAIAKSIAAKEKTTVNADQELRALGLANLTGAFFSTMPVTGGFSRTAVNYQSGAKSILASLISAVLVMITLLYLTPLFYYLPNAVLAAIIMVAVYGLIDLNEGVRLFKLKKSDGWVFLITFLITLLIGIEAGILSGVAASLLIFIWRSAYPHMAQLGYLANEDIFRNIDRYPQAETFEHMLIIRVDASLYFANMAFLENNLDRLLQDHPHTQWIVIDMSGVNDMDAVAIDTLQKIINEYKEREVSLVFANVKGPVRDLMVKVDWPRAGRPLMFGSLQHAVDHIHFNS